MLDLAGLSVYYSRMDKNISGSDYQSQSIRISENQKNIVPRHEKLWIWQKSHNLALQIHEFCKILPRDEQFNLAHQIKRSSKSVSDNIAEANASYYYNDKIKGLYIARKESAETQNHLRDLEDKNYLIKKESQSMINQYEEIIRGINGLISSICNKRNYTKCKGNKKL